jgi:hypothetical protein
MPAAASVAGTTFAHRPELPACARRPSDPKLFASKTLFTSKSPRARGLRRCPVDGYAPAMRAVQIVRNIGTPLIPPSLRLPYATVDALLEAGGDGTGRDRVHAF